jgi:regulator of protease activity HflC (stomatin/prohibitin superfamily)
MAIKGFEVVDGHISGGGGLRFALIGVAILLFVLIGNPFTVVPAGDVGVKAFFGNVSASILPAGIHVVMPFTKIVNM